LLWEFSIQEGRKIISYESTHLLEYRKLWDFRQLFEVVAAQERYKLGLARMLSFPKRSKPVMAHWSDIVDKSV